MRSIGGFLFFCCAHWVAVLAWGADHNRVVVLGGGVAGLSAAHELAERGFAVTVYESKDIAGGKARSMPVPGTGTEGRRDLPGEHGFRFFPGFYTHLTDTMKRIPFGRNRQGVFDNLVPASRLHMATKKAPTRVLPTRPPRTPQDIEAYVRFFLGYDLDISKRDFAYFARKLFVVLTSCQERRLAELENISWWDFIGAATRSEDYKKFLGVGLSRSLVAARAEEASARTIGETIVQLIFDLAGKGNIDRLLNGPTNEVWIDPWVAYLRTLGVDYRTGSSVESLDVEDGKIAGAMIRQGDRVFSATADYYVAAVPVEVMRKLVSPALAAADPNLSGLAHLKTEWMNGIQFFLANDMPLAHGHSIYYDTPWALTSVSQAQFWPKVPLERRGNGKVHGILSVDISDWDKPGIVFKKPARLCTAEEIKEEVLAQVMAHLSTETAQALRGNVVGWFLDPSVTFPEPGHALSVEPLLVNTVDSWRYRPEAATAVPNLFLAADYVRTYTDIACMEGANEAARRAVNAILDAAGSKVRRCMLWPLKEPRYLAGEKAYDKERFKRGLPNRWNR